MPTSTARGVRSSSHDYPAPLDLFVIVRGIWRLHAAWGRPDDDVVIDAPADYHQRNQDQDDVGHVNSRDHGRDQPYSRHDGGHTEELLTSPSHGLGLPKNDPSYAGGCLRSASRSIPTSTARSVPSSSQSISLEARDGQSCTIAQRSRRS
jgi:hypothetical protein